MKVGADNPKKTLAAVGLFVLALLLFARTFLSGGSASASYSAKAAQPSAVPAVPKARTQAPAQRRSSGARTSSAKKKGDPEPSFTASLDPRLRLDLLSVAEQTQYSGSGRNIFRMEAAPLPKPVAPVMKPMETPKTAPAGPPPPPPPPPINLKFFGFATSVGAPKRIFLASGDDVFIAQEGDIVNRRYKILRIGSTSVEVQDLLNNRTQSLPLTG
jgi:hypothetical protein